MVVEALILGGAWVTVQAIKFADRVHARQLEADIDPRLVRIRERRRLLERRRKELWKLAEGASKPEVQQWVGRAMKELERDLEALADEEGQL